MTTLPAKDIIFALIEQVTKARPPGGNEQEVITVISRPMWDLWCESLGATEPVDPSNVWSTDCWRVYGSETVVVESTEYFSHSRSRYV